MSAAKNSKGGPRRTATGARKTRASKAGKKAAGRKKTGTASRRVAAKKKTAKKKTPANKKTAKKKTAATRKKAPTRAPRKKTPATAKKAGKKAGKKTAATKKTAARAAGRKKAATTTRKIARKTGARGTTARKAKATRKTPASAPKPRPSALRYKEALDAYAKAVHLLQEKDWQAASRALADVVSEFPRERELAERARMYLRVCSQHLEDDDGGPDDFDDLYYRAVVLSNRGRTDRALEIVERALAFRSRSRKAMYLKASILATGKRRREALDALAAAIELDDQNRIYATNDPDFAGLRDDEEFITLTTREDDEES